MGEEDREGDGKRHGDADGDGEREQGGSRWSV